MITRAVVEMVSVDRWDTDTRGNTYPVYGSIKVRIPIFHGAKGSMMAAQTNDLPDASICVLPNELPNIQVGDIVFVGFEDHDASKPVILGYLYGSSPYTTKCSLSADSLRVETQTELGANTYIGQVSPNEIECLKGLVGSVQGQLNQLSDRITALGG